MIEVKIPHEKPNIRKLEYLLDIKYLILHFPYGLTLKLSKKSIENLMKALQEGYELLEKEEER